MVYKLFDKKTSYSGIKIDYISNKRSLDLVRVAKVSDCTRVLAEELNKPIVRKFN